MIVLRSTRPLSAAGMARIKAALDTAIAGNKIVVVDSSIDVFVDGDSEGITFISDADPDALQTG